MIKDNNIQNCDTLPEDFVYQIDEELDQIKAYRETRGRLDPVSTFAPLREGLRNAVQGRDDVIDLILVALLADGHVLLEDHPGSGKTTLARTLGSLIETRSPARTESNSRLRATDGATVEELPSFRRIQFTPDLMPTDILGVSIFNPQTSTFTFRRGPVFTHLLLADEINRTSPKVQAALLEAMAEKQVTAEERSIALDPLFMVLATQNPFDSAGTYPLPAAQLDRFLFRIHMGYITSTEELIMLKKVRPAALQRMAPVAINRDEILSARLQVDQETFVADSVYQCLVEIANALRAHSRVLLGPSSRSLVQMKSALKASAALDGRDFVSAQDIRRLALPVFGHRTHLNSARSRAVEEETRQVIEECLQAPLEKLIRSGLAARPAQPMEVSRREM